MINVPRPSSLFAALPLSCIMTTTKTVGYRAGNLWGSYGVIIVSLFTYDCQKYQPEWALFHFYVYLYWISSSSRYYFGWISYTMYVNITTLKKYGCACASSLYHAVSLLPENKATLESVNIHHSLSTDHTRQSFHQLWQILTFPLRKMRSKAKTHTCTWMSDTLAPCKKQWYTHCYHAKSVYMPTLSALIPTATSLVSIPCDLAEPHKVLTTSLS